MNDKDRGEFLDVIFRTARSQNKWQDTPVSDETLRELYELMKWGPTSNNSNPMRLQFVRSEEGKDRLAKFALGANGEKILTAPVTAIIAFDLDFYEDLPKLFPHRPGNKDTYANNQQLAYDTAFRNSSLQGAYLMIAARALGLDCGPMSGFDNAGVDAEFFSGTNIRSNFLCALGHGDSGGLFDRLPRHEFDAICELI